MHPTRKPSPAQPSPEQTASDWTYIKRFLQAAPLLASLSRPAAGSAPSSTAQRNALYGEEPASQTVHVTKKKEKKIAICQYLNPRQCDLNLAT